MLFFLTTNSTHLETLKGILEEKSSSSNNIHDDLNPNEFSAFQEFISDPNNTIELEQINQQLNQKYTVAKTFAENVVQCQRNILTIRKALESNNCNSAILEDLNSRLICQQSVYREAILQLQNLRKETDHLKHGLRQVRIKLVRKFREAVKEKENERLNGEILEEEKSVLKETCRFNNSVVKDCVEVVNPKEVVENENEELVENLNNRVVVGEEVDDNVSKEQSTSVKPEELITSDGFENNKMDEHFKKFLKETDAADFVNFMQTVPLTGDDEVDDEIFSFYRTKFNCNK